MMRKCADSKIELKTELPEIMDYVITEKNEFWKSWFVFNKNDSFVLPSYHKEDLFYFFLHQTCQAMVAQR